MDRYPRSDSIVQGRTGLQTYMAQVYGWMTVGLLLTAFIAWFAANTPAVMMFVFSSKITFFGLIIAQLALVFVLSGMVQRLSAGMATTLFMLYSALTGLTLSSIFIAYTYSSIASTFVVTGGMFGAMSLYGYTTKRDLSGFGSMLFMGLIGIVLASLVNLWLKSEALMWASTELQADREVVYAALSNDPQALTHAAPTFRSDKSLLLSSFGPIECDNGSGTVQYETGNLLELAPSLLQQRFISACCLRALQPAFWSAVTSRS